MRERAIGWRGVLVAAALMVAAGCARQTGERGELIFMYESVEDPTNFNKPIAQGARLEILVHDVRRDEAAHVVEARSKDPDVVEITGTVAHLVGLKARSPGLARIEVRAVDDQGIERADAFTIRVAPVERLLLEDDCWHEESRPLVLTGAKLYLPWSRRSSTNEPLTGFGIFPLRVEPEAAGELRTNSVDQGGGWLDVARHVGRFEVRPTVGGGDGVAFEAVDAEAIDGVVRAWPPPSFARGSWTIRGVATFVEIEPRVGGRPLCQLEDFPHEVDNLTPELCEVEPLAFAPGLVKITGRAFGACRYEVRFPGGGADAGATFTTRVGRLPGEEGSGSRPEPGAPWWLAPLLALLAPLGLAPLLALLAPLGLAPLLAAWRRR